MVSVTHRLEVGSPVAGPRGRTRGRGWLGGTWGSEISAQLGKSSEAFSQGSNFLCCLIPSPGVWAEDRGCARGQAHQSTREGVCPGVSPGLLSVPSPTSRGLECGVG